MIFEMFESQYINLITSKLTEILKIYIATSLFNLSIY